MGFNMTLTLFTCQWTLAVCQARPCIILTAVMTFCDLVMVVMLPYNYSSDVDCMARGPNHMTFGGNFVGILKSQPLMLPGFAAKETFPTRDDPVIYFTLLNSFCLINWVCAGSLLLPCGVSSPNAKCFTGASGMNKRTRTPRVYRLHRR